MRQLKISQSITERTDETLEAYLNDISKKNTVTPNEEVELARKYRNQFLLQIRKIERQYEQEENRPATIEEIADALETDPEKVRNTLVAASHSMSLDAPVGDEEDTALVDLTTNLDAVQTDHTLDMESLNQTLDMVLKTALKERDIFIIKQTFGIGCPEKSQEEVSEMLGLTRERVRQIRERALHKLKKYKFLLCF